MKKFGKKIDVVVYPDAGHGFENPNNKDGYRQEDASKAWDTTVKFLDSHLKKGSARAKHPVTHDDEDGDIELDDHRVPTLTTCVAVGRGDIL